VPLRGGEGVLAGSQDQPSTAIMSDAERHDDDNPTTSAAGELAAGSFVIVLLCFCFGFWCCYESIAGA
jgi:hypothetical protein